MSSRSKSTPPRVDSMRLGREAFQTLMELRRRLDAPDLKRADVSKAIDAALQSLAPTALPSIGARNQLRPLALPEWGAPAESVRISYSEEQWAVIRNARSHHRMKVKALAGTGKTTTLRGIAEDQPGRGLYIAFNKSLQREAKQIFPRHIESRTGHSLALEAISPMFAGSGKQITDLTLLDITKLLDLRGELAGITAWNIREAFNRFCSSLDQRVGDQHLAASAKVLASGGARRTTLDHLDDQSAIVSGAQELWDLVTSPGAKHAPLTHDAYLKLWALHEPKIDADYILFDEFQDATPVLINLLEAQSARIIAVGDPSQAIYAFRGAVNAIQSRDYPEFTLSRTYRFGTEIAAAANATLKLCGETAEMIGCNPNPGRIEEIDRRSPHAVIARTNAALCIEAARWAHRVPTAVVGHSRTLPDLVSSLDALLKGDLGAIRNPTLKQFASFTELASFADRTGDAECRMMIRLVRDHGDEFPQIVEALTTGLVKESQATLVLSTGHNAKGREFEKVRLANDFAKPFRSGQVINVPKEELYLLYVAQTRAKSVLEPNDALSQVMNPDGNLDAASLAIIDECMKDVSPDFEFEL